MEGDGFPGSPYTSTADDDGSWSITLANDTLPDAEGPYSLELCSSTSGSGGARSGCLEADNVYFGDVILCSGQSNMERDVDYVYNSTAEVRWLSIQRFEGQQSPC